MKPVLVIACLLVFSSSLEAQVRVRVHHDKADFATEAARNVALELKKTGAFILVAENPDVVIDIDIRENGCQPDGRLYRVLWLDKNERFLVVSTGETAPHQLRLFALETLSSTFVALEKLRNSR